MPVARYMCLSSEPAPGHQFIYNQYYEQVSGNTSAGYWPLNCLSYFVNPLLDPWVLAAVRAN
jgi:hypothetical protein